MELTSQNFFPRQLAETSPSLPKRNSKRLHSNTRSSICLGSRVPEEVQAHLDSQLLTSSFVSPIHPKQKFIARSRSPKTQNKFFMVSFEENKKTPFDFTLKWAEDKRNPSGGLLRKKGNQQESLRSRRTSNELKGTQEMQRPCNEIERTSAFGSFASTVETFSRRPSFARAKSIRRFESPIRIRTNQSETKTVRVRRLEERKIIQRTETSWKSFFQKEKPKESAEKLLTVNNEHSNEFTLPLLASFERELDGQIGSEPTKEMLKFKGQSQQELSSLEDQRARTLQNTNNEAPIKAQEQNVIQPIENKKEKKLHCMSLFIKKNFNKIQKNTRTKRKIPTIEEIKMKGISQFLIFKAKINKSGSRFVKIEEVPFRLNLGENKALFARKIVILNSDFMRLDPVRCFSLAIPVYGSLRSLRSLKRDYENFLDYCKKSLCLGSNISHLFLPNQSPLVNLATIPPFCNFLLVSQHHFCQFFSSLRSFHSTLGQLEPPKANFLLNFINSLSDPGEISSLLSSRPFFESLVADSLKDNDLYHDLLGTRNFLEIKNHKLKIRTGLEKEVAQEINRARKEAGLPLGVALEKKKIRKINEFDEEMQEYYKRKEAGDILLGPAQELQNLLNAEEISDEEVYKEPERFNEELESLLDKEYPGRKLLGKKERETLIAEQQKPTGQRKQLHIKRNIDETRNKEEIFFRDIVRRFPTLAQLNIPVLESGTDFSRKELHKLFSRFKTLTEMSAVDSKSLRFRKFISPCPSCFVSTWAF